MIVSRFAISAICCAGAMLFAAQAQAMQRAQLWELEVTTASGGGDSESVSNWSCMADSDWSNPPVALTGAQCPAQTFTRQGDVLSWTVDCDTAQGAGEWTFSRNDRSVEGQSQVTSDDITVVTGIDGKAVDRCTL